MSESHESKTTESIEVENEQRREFVGSLGKWSKASALALVGSAAWVATAGSAKAGWLNGRGGGGGGWINGGGGWINRRGGGGWINRR
jgi:hypothetical protein